MRDYGSVHTCFWSNTEIQGLSDQAKLLALYLLTGLHTNMLGCFRLPVGYIAEDLSWSSETVIKRFKELTQIGFATRDETTQWVLIPKFLEWNQIENPNQGKSIQRLFDQVPKNSRIFKPLIEVLLAYQKHLEPNFINSLQTLLKPFLNQEQEQEQDQEQKQDQEERIVAPARLCSQKNSVLEVFNHWKKTLQHNNAVLDNKRRKLIKNALKSGYSVVQLCDAITGCSYTPHNMGENDHGQRYDGLHVILRDADQIDRFIRNAYQPPRPPNAADKLMLSNIEAGKSWLNKKCQEETKSSFQGDANEI